MVIPWLAIQDLMPMLQKAFINNQIGTTEPVRPSLKHTMIRGAYFGEIVFFLSIVLFE